MQAWPVEAALWFLTQQRHDGLWVVIVGMHGAPVMMSRPFETADEAARAVGRVWGRMVRPTHEVLIGAEGPDTGPI